MPGDTIAARATAARRRPGRIPRALALAAALLPAVQLAAVAPAGAQSPPFLSLEPLGPERGLSQAAVTAITEDDLGFLWIGTQDGLNRFDGQRFQVRRAGDAPGELRSGSIDALAFDGRSRLWIGSNDAGLEVIDRRSGTHVRLGVEDGLSHPTVGQVLLDPAGGAWLGTFAGVDYVDDALSGVRRLGLSAPIVAMGRDGLGRAHALDRDCRLWRIDTTSMQAIGQPLPAGLRCIGMQPSGSGWWIATASDGLVEVDGEGQRLQALPAAALRDAQAELTALGRLGDGRLLVGYADGEVLQGSPAIGPLQRYAFDRPIRSAIHRFHEQADGVLWIGTHTGGLFRGRVLSSAIRRNVATDEDHEAWPARSIRSVHWEPGRILVGTDAGLSTWGFGEGGWRRQEAIGFTSIRAIAPDPRGGFWIGSHRGLWRLGDDGEAVPGPALPDPRVTDLLLEGEVLWVATRGGLVRLRDGVADATGVPPRLDGQFLTTLERAPDGALWIGSNERGVFVLGADGQLAQRTVANGGLPHDSVWSIHVAEDAVWLGSYGGGVVRVDAGDGSWRQWTRADGLTNDVIYAIQPDALGRLWLSTNEGLNVLDPASGRLQAMLQGDGLRNIEYNSGASFRDGFGRLFFGGIDGLDLIEPARLESAASPARPALTTLQVLGRRGGGTDAGGPARELGYAEAVALDYEESVFAIEMVALDFVSPASARLRYRISGLHDDWVQPPAARAELMLSYLPPGEYHLEVQAAGRDGRFGDSRHLRLDVAPPPWRHPLAWALYVLAALGLAAALVQRQRARRAAAVRRFEELERTVVERTAALNEANERLRSSNQQLERATRTDPLTQASNRRDLQDWLEREGPLLLREIEASGVAQPGSARQLLFCMIDIDDFKRLNDGYGHQVGDEVLVAVATRLRGVLRERDTLVRWGGEEFLLLARDARLEDASGLAERVRQAVCASPVPLGNGQSVTVTCSVGFAPWPLSAAWPALGDWEQSVSLADRALYAAKGAGKNAWVGVLPGPEVDRNGLHALLAGADPDALRPGCVQVLHSTPRPPDFSRRR